MDDSRGAGLPEVAGGRKTICRVKLLQCGATKCRRKYNGLRCRESHAPPNSKPGRSGFVFSRKQFGRRIRRCTSAPVTQNHFGQILSIDTAAITLRRPAGLANHFSSPEKPRERSDRATIIVPENTLQLDFSTADSQRRRIEHVCCAPR